MRGKRLINLRSRVPEAWPHTTCGGCGEGLECNTSQHLHSFRCLHLRPVQTMQDNPILRGLHVAHQLRRRTRQGDSAILLSRKCGLHAMAISFLPKTLSAHPRRIATTRDRDASLSWGGYGISRKTR